MEKHDSGYEENDEVASLVAQSGNEELCRKVLAFIKKRCDEEHIVFLQSQWLSLVIHVSVMVGRFVRGEKLAPLDRSIFSEISPESRALAEEIVGKMGDGLIDEACLLSVHLENAKLQNANATV